MKSRFYSYETRQTSCRDYLRQFLKDSGIYYELSGCFDGFHFEIEANPEQASAINAFLDTI